jgi:N-acetylmuramoyl-L-alanine amidase
MFLKKLLKLVIAGLMALVLACVVAAPQRAGAQAQGARLLGGAAEAGIFGRNPLVRLQLEGAAPFRVFTLADPPRLVVDLEGVVAAGFAPDALEAARFVAAARAGPMRPGWSRLVIDLARPLALATAELRAGVLEIRLARVSAAAFDAASAAPPGVWPPAGPQAPSVLRGAGPITVAIDAGHGGPDPGATRAGLEEKDIVLAFARDLAASLTAAGGFRVVLTRDANIFLSLAERVARARAAGADALISIHTNAASGAEYGGAILFTRSETGSDGAASARALIENRADERGGVDPAGPQAPVLEALAGMARVETDARSRMLAGALAETMAPIVGPLAPFPLRSANFIVLGAAELPSVLLEIGFLSNDADRANMTDPLWRRRAADAVAAGLALWRDRDAALAARLRR